jgi:putative transposase
VKGKTIGEVFEAGRGDGVDIDLLDDLMMAEDLRKVGRNGVKFLGSNYWAEELYGLKEKVIIKYSLFDLSYIKVYGTDGRYIAKAETVLSVHPMASVLGDAKDMYSLNRAIKETRRLQNETKKKARKLLPHIDKNPLPYQKIDEIEEKAEQQKYSEKKDYSGVSVDVSKLPVIKEEKTEEMPLYEWQIEEMRRQQAQ